MMYPLYSWLKGSVIQQCAINVMKTSRILNMINTATNNISKTFIRMFLCFHILLLVAILVLEVVIVKNRNHYNHHRHTLNS